MESITFYPGPSKIYPSVAGFMQEAFENDVLSMNHRSEGFMEILKETIQLFRQKLEVPTDYSIYFVSSATEAWEIVAQSLTQSYSLHFHNGAFGKKWFHYAANIVPQASATWFDYQQSLVPYLFEREIAIKQHNLEQLAKADVVCLTQNETSNGTQLTNETIANIQSKTEALMAVDVTSSMGGVILDWQRADIWLASVQKCFGLPAGLGIMVCSPKALKRAETIGDRLRYNSLLLIEDNFKKFQTHYTPNVLAIYLLMKVLGEIPTIQKIDKKITTQAKNWYDFFETKTDWEVLIQNTTVRSDTVIAIKGSIEAIKNVKTLTKQQGITLGNGYGEWKASTFRIANFPAITPYEIEQLKAVLSSR
jgi:phosphoserine aminotransferase